MCTSMLIPWLVNIEDHEEICLGADALSLVWCEKKVTSMYIDVIPFPTSFLQSATPSLQRTTLHMHALTVQSGTYSVVKFIILNHIFIHKCTASSW